MLHYRTGNMLESSAQALVNTVNTVGVMGKGIALQFKQLFPDNTKRYQEACKTGQIAIGKLLVTKDSSLLTGEKTIINFPTKADWRKPSEYNYIEAGLKHLIQIVCEQRIKSVAIPALGSGNGGLEWAKVKSLIEKHLWNVEADFYIYEPNTAIQEVLKKERVKLTPARAMLLDVLYDLTRNGEFVSEFSSEKIAYFLQRFGGKEIFKLEFNPNFYGPYSGKVRHVLYYLNGSYIFGYSAKDKRPFEELGIISNGEKEVQSYLDANPGLKAITEKVKSFLTGFYSPFGLELLSTIDFLITEKNVARMEEVMTSLEEWSERKKTLFTNPKHVKVALERIQLHMGQLQA